MWQSQCDNDPLAQWSWGIGAVRSPLRAGMTRRQFLHQIGRSLGAAAVMNTMTAWGLLGTSAQEAPPVLDGDPNGTSVVVLGAGPGGCAAAYELIQLGYDVTILEAQEHVGGHALTVRSGTRIHEFGGEPQVCDWDEGLWWDAGPSRVPFFHRAFFYYCRLFGIPLANYENFDLNAWVYAEGIEGNLAETPVRFGKMLADMAGYTSELLYKTHAPEKLDEYLTPADQELLLDYLTRWGMLSETGSYATNDRIGYSTYPGVGTQRVKLDPYPLEDVLPLAASLVQSQQSYLSAVPVYDWQSTLVYPVGGMGQLYANGFQPAFRDRLKLRAPVLEIRQSDEQVRIVYTDPNTGEPAELVADYCLCNIPLSVLTGIEADFSSEFREAIARVPYAMTFRMGLAFDRRFWEEDDWIYGGQSYFNNPQINIIQYPTEGYGSQKGVLLGSYAFGLYAARMSARTNQERVDYALDYVSRIHPTMRDSFSSGISVAWHRMPYQLGAYPAYSSFNRSSSYERLLQPDGRVYLVGEHLSYVNAWQEGAFQAAWYQIEQLHTRVMQG